MENHPVSIPPRKFGSKLQKMLYYLGSPGVTAAVGLYIGAFLFLGMFTARYIQQEMWYSAATKVANARIVGAEYNRDMEQSVYKVEYTAPNGNGELKTGYMVTQFVSERYLGEPLPIILGENNLVIWDRPASFYKLGWAFVLFVLWIAIPSFALWYFIKPRRKDLQLLEMGLGAIAKLEKVDKSVLSTNESPKRLYNFEFDSFDGKRYEAKVTGRSGQWSEMNPEALVLYDMKSPKDFLVVDAMDSAPKIDEEGRLKAMFSEKAMSVIAVTLLLVVGFSVFLSFALFTK